MIVVFTPTNRPGSLAEQYHHLLSQNIDEDITWLIQDELYDLRKDIVAENTPEIHTVHYQLPIDDGYFCNLAKGYNVALDYARKAEASLFVSYQDYIWIPYHGIREFKIAADNYPESILTGLTSWSSDPPVNQIKDKDGPWTIFGEPYTNMPETISWIDCRISAPEIRDDCVTVTTVDSNSWEANWAAIPSAVINDPLIKFDERYDKGSGFENQDFAHLANKMGYEVLLIETNHAISMPHKAYFPEQEVEKHKHKNWQMHCRKWGMPLPEDWQEMEKDFVS